MSMWVSRIILCLSALVIAAPADYCMLKMTGICCGKKAPPACSLSCCAEKISDKCENEAPCDNPSHNHKSCCAYTSAELLNVSAQDLPVLDMHCDLPPLSLFNFDALVVSIEPTLGAAFSLSTYYHPQSADSPLFLRVHTFLI